MTMIKFDLYEEYLEERTKGAESVNVFIEREQKAEEVHVKLVKEYENLIKESVTTGKDIASELDKLDSQIVKASRLHERRKEETKLARSMNGKSSTKAITIKDIIDAFYSEYAPKVQESVIPSVNERLELARNLILSAISDVKQSARDYDSITEEIKKLSEAAHRTKETNVFYSISNPINDSSIRRFVSKLDEDIGKVSTGQGLPADVEYMKEVK